MLVIICSLKKKQDDIVLKSRMPSWPGDLFFFSFLITERTSPGDVGDAGNAIGRGEKMNSFTGRI